MRAVVVALIGALLGLGCWSEIVVAGPAGPFGTTFGAPEASIHYKRLQGVDLKAGDDRCARAAFATSHGVVPDDWRINLNDAFGNGTVPIDVETGLQENRLKADLTIGNRLKASWYAVPVGGKTLKICFAFFDNALFLVESPIDEWVTLSDEIEVSVSQRYGTPDRYCGGSVCAEDWVSVQDQVVVEKVTSLAGELTYTYAPIKAKELVEVVNAYWAHYKSVGGKSTF